MRLLYYELLLVALLGADIKLVFCQGGRWKWWKSAWLGHVVVVHYGYGISGMLLLMLALGDSKVYQMGFGLYCSSGRPCMHSRGTGFLTAVVVYY